MAGEALKRSAVMDAAALCETDWSDGEAISLDTAISLLEAGKTGGDMLINFGDGDEKLIVAGPGLLQRLKGHRMLLAVAEGAADLSAARSIERKIYIDPDAEALLGVLPGMKAMTPRES